MSEGEKDGGGGECPVCYEKLRDLEGAGRTLSCGHVFCHDCLVKYLLARRAEAHVPQTLVCPVCRYVTFLSRRGPRRPPDPARGLQTLPQVFTISTSGMPLAPDAGPPTPLHAASSSSSSGLRLPRCRSPMLLLVVLVAVVAGLVAILPWILLARRRA
ncbi:RING finger protein 222 [Tachyglossus aculeatus]|uniref:RING finger protein 222 n=1 Tax=Tachyglossus aculeatus TaxID=9261 RepID=UPI0018F2A21B|nr:RING finger protein 222 [Tachyglossus aculeatus]